jgi:hypothetical protein
MKEFLHLVIGTDNWPMYFAEWFFAIAGIVVSLLIGVANRKPLSETSPVHFSFSFFWSDNFRRIMTTVILVFLTLRFANELIGVDISLWGSLGIGLVHDSLAGILKKKNVFGIGQ